MKKNNNKIILLLCIAMLTLKLSAQTDSLQHYLEIAAKQNPGLKSAYSAYQATLEQKGQVGTLPELQLDMGFYLKPMAIIDGNQVADFSVMQMFPWFGTKKAAQAEVNHTANVAFEKFRETRNQLFLELYTQWFQLANLKQQSLNLEQHKIYLQQLERLASNKYSTANQGTSGISEILRIQLESMEINNKMESLQSAIKAATAQFNALLNRPSYMDVQIPDSITQIPFLLDVETAMGTVMQNNPELSMIQEETKAFQAKAEADKKAGMPTWGVGLQYSIIEKRDASVLPVSPMNGMDMVMPMVSVSIPLYRNKYKAQQQESLYWQQAGNEKYADTYNQLQAELIAVKHQLEDAARTIKLIERQNELAQTTWQLVLNEFATGKSDLSDVIQVQRQLLDYNLKRSEAIAAFNVEVAKAQKLMVISEL